MSGPVAVVTGGASGFGRALAERLASNGHHLALLDLDGERAEREAAAISDAHGVSAFGRRVDVTNGEDVDEAAVVVVSNVGVQLLGSVERLTDDEWKWVLDVNVVGSARTARAFVPLLRETPGARLAFTTSSSVLAPGSRMAAYQASKSAVWGLAETLHLELADTDVTVSVIFPSGMVTRHLETSEAAQPDHVRRSIGEGEDFEAMLASNSGLARDLATPEDAVASTIDALLAGERYIVTHGDLVDAVDQRGGALRAAATRANGGPS